MGNVPQIEFETADGGYDSNYGYLVHLSSETQSIVVDAAIPPEILMGGQAQDPIGLMITHTHADHLAYLGQWLDQYPSLQLYGSEHPLRDDLPNYNGLAHGSIIEVAGLQLEMIATPGHYADSVCWLIAARKALFTGDTMFVGRTGRTLSPQSSISDLFDSVYSRLFRLPGDTVIYPGHNYGPTPTATLEELRSNWPFYQCGNLPEFRHVMESFERARNG